MVCTDPRSAFLDVLSSSGFATPRSLSIGKLERIDGPDDKRGKKSGWYIYNEIEDVQQSGHIIGIASYGCWKTNMSESWCSRSEHQMDAQERANYQAARETMRIERENEKLKNQKEAASVAFELWNNSDQANDNHGYLKKKGVIAHQGIKVGEDKRLIIPMAVDNQIVSLQFIDKKGEKRFLTNGRIKGGWFIIEGEEDVIYIAEGYSTAASMAEATGKSVYVAFNAGNIYEVAAYVKNKHQSSRCIISGDDDINTTGNPGRVKAEQAAEGLGLECVFPPGFVDFNDMHMEQGIEALKVYLSPQNIEVYQDDSTIRTDKIERPVGILGDIIDYYHATSGNRQNGFAIQTALAITSIILARSYKTSLDNYSNLYLLNVAKSGTGKEHAKTITEKILYQANLAYLIAGDGYTSAGAVFSTLLDRPKHISVIDEFGRYLEAGRDMGRGNQHQREANTKLMEAIGRSHSVMRPPSYSSMTLKKADAAAIKNRMVHNPSITLLTMTTPDTLFKALDIGSIKDGFINRFIISISDAKREIRKHKPPIDVPDRIIGWIKEIIARNDKAHIALEPAATITLDFTKQALDAQLEFQKYCVDKMDYLERFGMAELPGRSNEMAMKISLICALSRNVNATEIGIQDIEWAIAYVKQCLGLTIDRLKITISHSDFEHQKKEILADLRERGAEGITRAEMMKQAPYAQHKLKDLKEIMDALKDADLAIDQAYQPDNGGRPSIRWIALN